MQATRLHVNRSGKGSQSWNILLHAGNYPGNRIRLQVNQSGKKVSNAGIPFIKLRTVLKTGLELRQITQKHFSQN
jgi:hypothetical protein